MRSPVISKIVENGLCIGCGMCAAMCPDDVLKMSWNDYGEYNPIEAAECLKNCGICLKICPFSDDNDNEDVIGKRLFEEVPKIDHNPFTGYYLASYVGYSEDHRTTSASGGVATWTLETLLRKNIVDAVICVAPTGDPDKLFTFQIFDTVEGLRSGSGAAYYPVQMSDVIRHVLDEPRRYAITGLPCFIKAIRLAQARNEKLRKRIVATVGLVCGQLKSKLFTEYIASLTGIEGNVCSVYYRGKDPDQPASNYHYVLRNMDGDERRIFWNDGISNAWTNRWFTPMACDCCDDVFSECADVTFMDAWLPEYSKDGQGTSLVIVRAPWAQELIAQGEGIVLKPISIDRVVDSQRGVCLVKRDQLAYRLFLEEKSGRIRLVKRVAPHKTMNLIKRREMLLKDRMRGMSGENWIKMGGNLKLFHDSMRPELRNIQLIHTISKILILPKLSYRFVKRRLL